MSGALASGKHWTMVAGVSIFTFCTIESPITRALSSGFSVGASLSGENLFDILIGTEERCFDPRLCCLTVTQLPCSRGAETNRNRTMYRSPSASRIQSSIYSPHILTVWMRVSNSEIFSVSLTISLNLSHVNPSLLTETDKLYMWQAVQVMIQEEAITHHDCRVISTRHSCLMDS